MINIFIIINLVSCCLSKVIYRQNHLSHLSDEEFKQIYLNNDIKVDDKRDLQITVSVNPSDYNLSNYLDWRQAGVVNPIRDQGRCGSCWAHSAIAIIESSVAINHGQLMYLSEKQLIDCDHNSNGCNGGSVNLAILYALKNGVCTQKYQSGTDNNTCQRCNQVVKVTKSYPYRGYKQMVLAIQKGPITANIDASNLRSYGSGIIDASFNCTIFPNHVVTLVGYDQEVIDGQTVYYWIARNSWGSDWGENGYFKIVSGENKCGIELSAFGVDAYQIAPNDYTPPKLINPRLRLMAAFIFIGVLFTFVIIVNCGIYIYLYIQRYNFHININSGFILV